MERRASTIEQSNTHSMQKKLFFLLFLLVLLLILLFNVDFSFLNKTDEMRYPITLPDSDHQTVCVLTYNTNTQDPDIDLSKLILFDGNMHDIYVIGLQEMHLTTTFNDNWLKKFDEIFSKKNYVRLKRIKKVSLELLAYVPRERLISFYSLNVGEKFFDWFYMKGALALRFIYYNIKFCFVNSHLPAHLEKNADRISSYKTTMESIHFGKTDRILSQDLIFYFGDLNFRLESITPTEVVEYIQTVESVDNSSRYEYLLKHDQLLEARRSREALHNFNEPAINFAPTYKFKIGTQTYALQRTPSYTDRILIRTHILDFLSPNETKQLSPNIITYTSLPQFTISDHKPVVLVVSIPIKKIAEQKSLLPVQSLRKRSLMGGLVSSIGAKEQPKIQSTVKQEELKQTSSESEDDSSVDKSEFHFTVQFCPVNWNASMETFQASFNIVDELNNVMSIHDPKVKKYLSSWDWIALYKPDFMSVEEDYITYSFPNYWSFIEQAEEAIEHSDSEQDDSVDSITLTERNCPSTSQIIDESLPSDDDIHNDQQISRNISKRKDSFESISDSDIGWAHGDHSESDQSPKLTDTTTIISSSSNTSLCNIDANVNLTNVTFNAALSPGKYILMYIRQNGDVIGISDTFEVYDDIFT